MLAKEIAERLLEIGAVVLSPKDPFTWSSGLKSPIYCDNRLTMAYPEVRNKIAEGFVQLIKENFGDAKVIAGTATAGIPHAAWVSQKLNLPMAYVRSSAKSHGKQKQIEGIVKAGDNVVVIEDLISTGGSSLTAVQALREAGAKVLGVAAIFTYGLPKAALDFEHEDLPWVTLTNFDTLMSCALESQQIDQADVDQLKVWHENPESQDWFK